jgi:sugar (pentulose or hexulose) kinase
MAGLALGLDLGSSGLRLALVDGRGQLLAEQSSAYPAAFDDPLGWREGFLALCQALPAAWRQQVGAVAIAGTSGTLLLCRPDGSLLSGPLARALPYHQACPQQAAAAAHLAGPCLL